MVTIIFKNELDIQNNGNFQLMGTSQILSVPYASHSNTATTSLTDNDTSATNEIQQLSLQGNQLVLSDGGSVNLTTTVDLDLIQQMKFKLWFKQ